MHHAVQYQLLFSLKSKNKKKYSAFLLTANSFNELRKFNAIKKLFEDQFKKE